MQTPMPRLRILFLCTGNSCRSQMAEGWARALKSDSLEAYSAGTEKHGINPYAVKVMAEAGVDISKQHSKTLAEIGPAEFDYVVINDQFEQALKDLLAIVQERGDALTATRPEVARFAAGLLDSSVA